jgi:hypothetical protein
MRRRKRVGLRAGHEESLHGIFVDIHAMLEVVVRITDSMFFEASLPNFTAKFKLAGRAEREPTLNELQGFFQGDICIGREYEMEVVGHYDVFVEQQSPVAPILLEGLHKQLCHARGLEDRAATGRDRRHEKGSQFLGRESHRRPGLKPRYASAFFRGAEAPRFHLNALSRSGRSLRIVS